MGIETLALIGTLVAAGASAGSLAYGIKSGQDQAAVQNTALKRQQTAQQKAEGQALSTERQGAIAQNAANMKTPDIASILARASQMSKGGAGGTMLTGPQGIDTSQLNLGKNTLLGS